MAHKHINITYQRKRANKNWRIQDFYQSHSKSCNNCHTLSTLSFIFFQKDSPEKPTISVMPLTPMKQLVEGQRAVLQCSSKSRSSPSYITPIGQNVITYTWLIDGSSNPPAKFKIANNSLTISRVDRTHTGIRLSCKATQNTKTSVQSKEKILTVLCKYHVLNWHY